MCRKRELVRGIGRVQWTCGGAVSQKRPLPVVVVGRWCRGHVILVREYLFYVAHQRYHQSEFADQQCFTAQRGHKHKAQRY